MWKYLILVCIWIGFTLYWILGSIPNQRFFEVFAGLGIGLCLTMLDFGIFGWFAGDSDRWFSGVLSVLGGVLTIIAIALVGITLFTLARRGKPRGGIERTSVFIDSGIFKYVRHPLYLGAAIWSIALILQTQELISAVLGIAAFSCFLFASIKEDAYNKSKFGRIYERYMEQVPMWNLFKRIFK